nr:hypothetical protein [uncultured Desulfuromonas sp.]
MKTINNHNSQKPPVVAPQLLEKYSSAITLSDMEIFIYPDLLYSLVLANIMSPVVWQWRDDPWFAKIDTMNPYRRILRLKQFIMDHYDFNLDLDTWGLTHKDTELDRFKDVMDPEIIAESNALFGYTGDRYYFDMNIRKHFGLDKYDSELIPYWKTETVEAMDAFCYRDGYRNGAGECVSLSTLYAAALFVVCKIPLEDIFLMATPLHSQNFVDVKEGLITNNRRIVTKNMWFNGTELSARAQRALRNEQVTMVAHCSGNIHAVYPEVSIDPQAYQRFSDKLVRYLKVGLNQEILCNFLREHSSMQKCFQVSQMRHGKKRWIVAEKVYSYEHGSSFKASDNTREKLLDEIDSYDYSPEPIEGRIDLERFEAFFKKYPNVNLDKEKMRSALVAEFNCPQQSACELIDKLREFIEITPRLPDYAEKTTVDVPPIVLTAEMDRQQVIDALMRIREQNPMVDLGFYALRDLRCCDWGPFVKAAMERNPVAVAATQNLSDDAVIEQLATLENGSIYSEGRLAQPDEVWNFQRGDGVERALCLADIWRARYPDEEIILDVGAGFARLSFGSRQVEWPTAKGLEQRLAL